MRLALKSTLKKSALITASTALAFTGLIAGSGTAQAAGPGGAQNVRGVDPGNTDAWLDELCGQQPYRDGLLYGALNVRTGEFRNTDETHKVADGLGYSPGGDWEYFSGYCTYPQSSTWSVKGKQVRISKWIGNHGTTEDKETIVRRYTTTTSYKKSVGANISFSLAKSIFTGTAGADINYEWGWSKESVFETRSEKSIPPCSQISMSWTPYQRVVRVNPVFNVVGYSWNKSNDPNSWKNVDNWTSVTTWRGRDASWKSIYSYGLYIDGVSDKVIADGSPDGSPDGREDKWQQALDPGTCA